MGTVVYTPGRTLQFRPIEGVTESLTECVKAADEKMDYDPLNALKSAPIAIRLPPMGESIEYSRLDQPLARASYIQPLVMPFYVRNDTPDLQEFEIF